MCFGPTCSITRRKVHFLFILICSVNLFTTTCEHFLCLPTVSKPNSINFYSCCHHGYPQDFMFISLRSGTLIFFYSINREDLRKALLNNGILWLCFYWSKATMKQIPLICIELPYIKGKCIFVFTCVGKILLFTNMWIETTQFICLSKGRSI